MPRGRRQAASPGVGPGIWPAVQSGLRNARQPHASVLAQADRMRIPAPPPQAPRPASATSAPAAAAVEIVIPVTSQQRDLALNVLRLHAFLSGQFPFRAHVTIADGGNSDGTWSTARSLADSFAEVSAVRIAAPGRGAALRAVWSASKCHVLAYLDTDLSIDLTALVPLVEPLLAGHADVAIGTRLSPGARPQDGPRREITSCGYSLLLQAGLGTGFADAQCGFKAITRACAIELLPLTSQAGSFFDAELLRLAERAGLRICEIPVNQPGGRDRPSGRRPRAGGHLPVRWRTQRGRDGQPGVAQPRATSGNAA
jgi:Glycosyl transferase family 2